MIRLTRNIIKNLASSETEYQRGIQYLQNGKVSNLSASAKKVGQYRALVKGNYNYTVVVDFAEDGSITHNCNCPAHIKADGACKHVVATLLAILRYQEHTMNAAMSSPEDKRAFGVINYFSNMEDIHPAGDVFHIEPVISIPQMLRNDSGLAAISFKVGSNKMYKVQTIRKFLSDYITNQNILLGKEFKFIANESEFDRISKRLLDFFLSVYDILELSDEAARNQVFNRSQVILSKFLFIKMLKEFPDTPFTLELYGKTISGVKFIPGNPNIEFDMFLEEDKLTLDYKDREPVIPVCDNGELLYRDGFLYMPDKRFLKNFLPFFNQLGGDKEPLVFNDGNKMKFLEQVLPKIHDVMDIEIPDELKERYQKYDFKAEIYFDKYGTYIKAEVIFVYDKYRFNCFDNPKTDYYIIVRDKIREQELMDLLEANNFEPHTGFYILKTDNDIYDFVNGGIDTLKDKADLFYSDSFKKMGRKRKNKFSVGMNIGSTIDLLEIDLQYGDISRAELKQMFRAYKLKKKFFRLTDGSFIDLESEDIEQMADILDDMNLSYKNIENDEPLKVSKNFAAHLSQVLSEHAIETTKTKELEDLLESLYNVNNSVYEVPEGINAELREYQKTGFKWLATLADDGFGGILADDMGLGKTLQSIVYMKYMKDRELEKGEHTKFLILCPTSLVYNWQDEIENFAPSLTSEVVTGTPDDRKASIARFDKVDVLITSYPLIRRDIELYNGLCFNTIFIDEAQFIKNSASLSAQAVKRLEGKHRFALTGTPIENSLSELWSIFDFIMPFYLLSHSKFVSKYEKKIIKEDTTALNALNNRIRPFVLRRMKKDVLKDLPDKIETKLVTEMTEAQQLVYMSFLDNIKSELNDEIAKNGFERSKMQILAALTRLRQICCHPSTFLDNYEGDSGKLELFMQILPDLLSANHRIIVFSQFTSMLEIIKDKLAKENIDFFYLEGHTKVSDRVEMVKQFNAGEKSVFLISLKAGGTGLNLTGADTVIHFDPWWNPAVEDQATDRAHRIGQQNTVHVIKLITKGTIEEKIYKLQKKKKELSDSIIQAKEVFINALTREEIEELFDFKA